MKNEQAAKVQAVINTLETLDMPSTYNNVNRMLGIYNTLVEVRDFLTKVQAAEQPNPETEEKAIREEDL